MWIANDKKVTVLLSVVGRKTFPTAQLLAPAKDKSLSCAGQELEGALSTKWTIILFPM